MDDRFHKRLTRYAAFAALHGLLVLAAVAGLGTIGWALAGIATLGFFWAWGAYQADLVINAPVEEPHRTRWRIAFWFAPWSMALYWYLYVRPRS